MRRVWIGIALCGVLLVGGCGGDDGENGSPPERAETAAPDATTARDATTAPEATETPTPTPEAVTEPEAIAEQTVKALAARETTVDMAVLGLEVNGELATLTMSFGVRDPEAAPDDEFSLYDLNGRQPLYVSLVDPVNLRRYKVVHDSDGSALESGAVETKVLLDSTTTAQYTFAAPPTDVTEIDVSVGDWPLFRDVPIAR